MDTHRDEPATKGDLDLVRKDLDQVKQELISKIDANGRKIDANGKKIDANSAKIDANGKKIDANSALLTRVSCQVVENHEQVDRLLSMSEKFEEYFDEIINTLDGVVSDFANSDQERIVMNARFDRVEKSVDKNKTDIKKIKTKLTMP